MWRRAADRAGVNRGLVGRRDETSFSLGSTLADNRNAGRITEDPELVMERRSDLLSAIAAIVLMVGATAWLVAFHHPYAAALMGALALAASVVLIAVRMEGLTNGDE